MDRDSAEKYVNYGQIRIKKKTCILLLALNLCFYFFSAMMFKSTAFIIICCIFGIINIAGLVIMIYLKMDRYKEYLVFPIIAVFLVIAINLLYFATLQYNNIFIWWEYVLYIGVQLLMVVPFFFLIKAMANKISKKTVATTTIAASSGALGYMIYFFCKYYLSSLDLSVRVGTIILSISAIIINIALVFVIIGFLYKSTIIKKYNLNETTNI